ncbi:hypothetical protein Avbf_16082 [Armadillidium vulgare]|nr:hypothetical protein Avbf_16082 [Armadillidium vulgare]
MAGETELKGYIRVRVFSSCGPRYSYGKVMLAFSYIEISESHFSIIQILFCRYLEFLLRAVIKHMKKEHGANFMNR